MKKLAIIMISLAALATTACSMRYTPVIHESNLQNVDFGSGRLRKGSACSSWILFFGPFGDNSIVKAAQNGRIRKAMIQEERAENYILFSRYCTDLYGE